MDGDGAGGQQKPHPVFFYVVDAWQQTPSARSYINCLLKKNKRKHFGRSSSLCGLWTFSPDLLYFVGVLEKPYEQENKELSVLYKKLFLVGKSGVGKTSTVDKLSGRGTI